MRLGSAHTWITLGVGVALGYFIVPRVLGMVGGGNG